MSWRKFGKSITSWYLNAMKKIYKFLALTVLVSFVGGLGSFLYLRTVEPQDNVLVFVTVGQDRSYLPAEVSSYEMLRADEHFSDIILAWTRVPTFAEDLANGTDGFQVIGERQEKENLMFALSSQNRDIDQVEGEAAAKQLYKQLEMVLAEYNSSTHAAFVLTNFRTNFVEGEGRALMQSIGIGLLLLVVFSSFTLAWDYALQARR